MSTWRRRDTLSADELPITLLLSLSTFSTGNERYKVPYLTLGIQYLSLV